MANFEKKSLDSPDETRTFDKGKADSGTVGGVKFGRFTLEPGWRWTENMKPTAKTDSCQATHTNYIVSGRIAVKMDSGEEGELGPGDIARVDPGHDMWVIGDEPCVMIDVTVPKE